MEEPLIKRSMDALNRIDAAAFKSTEKIPVYFILDDVRSGLNVGSIFRTADAFALQGIILCGITAQPPHREILKTALGSTDSVDWQHAEHIEEALSALKTQQVSIWAVEQTTGAVMAHNFLPQIGQAYALLFGNEVNGVSEKALQWCDGAIEIPQFGTKHSLNVAVAAGIMAWECSRKLRANLAKP